MKTADSIAEQSERKAARGAQEGRASRENTQPVSRKGKWGDASRIAAWRWQPGQSGNPGGRPKVDLAAEIAKAVFERNAEALYKAYSKAALRGNAYCFKELADRAYGKLKERVEHEMHPYHDLTDEQIVERIQDLKKSLGWPGYDAEQPSDSKPN